jgi:hypothetical protein
VEHATRHRTGGPGPFVTHIVIRLPSGLQRVATSRRHRKGHPPRQIEDPDEATILPPTRAAAFRHLWAPRRLGWWIAVLFAIGSTHFFVAALAATWPDAAPAALGRATTLGWIFFVGSIFFTSAAWLQWLEALNGDVATALDPEPQPWRWLGVRPRNLGYLACSVQLVGTILFNFNTADALIPDLSWKEQDLLVWTPNMIGSICFLVASGLACAEITHGRLVVAPRSISWWIAVINLAGSVAFQLSALDSFVGPEPTSPEMLFWSTLWTAVGALCFGVGAYLLVPELFDEP